MYKYFMYAQVKSTYLVLLRKMNSKILNSSHFPNLNLFTIINLIQAHFQKDTEHIVQPNTTVI